MGQSDRMEQSLDLDAIRDRLAPITPGPWARHGADVHSPDDPVPLLRGRDGTAGGRAQADADAQFAAHAPTDIAVLLKALDAAAEQR